MTCFSCEWYRHGETPYCVRYKPGFPKVGNFCRSFSYEPGSDEREESENV